MRIFPVLMSALGFLTAFLILPAISSADAQEPRRVLINLIPEKTDIAPGETILVAIEQTIAEGWHTYWINPGDSGEAPEIEWTLPQGFTAGKIRYPAPHRIDTGPLTSYGYDKKSVLLQEITAPEVLPEGPLALTANVGILVCKDICIPETGSYSITLNDGGVFDGSAYIDTVYNEMPTTLEWPATYSEKDGNFTLTLTIDQFSVLANMGEEIKFDIFPYEWGLVDNTAQPVSLLDGRESLTVTKKRGDRSLAALGPQKLLIAYNDREGNPAALEITAQPDVSLAAAGKEKSTKSTTDKNGADKATSTGFLAALAFAFLGGLILNLMPCVFPVLSMKALSLAKLGDKEQAQARYHGLAYTAGVMGSFALIAGVLIALQAAGAQIGWGFQLQNPAIVLALAYLFFVIGLSLSGWFDIGGHLANIGGRLAGHAGLTGSFFTGALATVVATPCTAPFMGAAMGYALTQPAAVSLTVFLMLGAGLAFPYLLLTWVPAIRHALPRPGAWMDVLKQFLAFPMYASAIWLLWVFSHQTGGTGVLQGLLGVLFIAFAVWLTRFEPEGRGLVWFVRGIAALALLAAATFVLTARTDTAPVTNAAAASASSAAIAFSPAVLENLLKDENAVFVNMTADWCITCKVNEKTALSHKDVKAAFAMQNISYVKGDWTRSDPAITEYLARYGRSGVPLYVYYAPRGEDAAARPDPVILPQILTPGIVLDAIGAERQN